MLIMMLGFIRELIMVKAKKPEVVVIKVVVEEKKCPKCGHVMNDTKCPDCRYEEK